METEKLVERLIEENGKFFFVSANGVKIQLKPQKNYIRLNQQLRVWKVKNPAPKPPMIEITLAGQVILQADQQDSNFRAAYREWLDDYRMTQGFFMIHYGVSMLPDAPYDESLVSTDLPAEITYLQALHAMNYEDEELNLLSELIASYDEVTNTGLKEAEKK